MTAVAVQLPGYARPPKTTTPNSCCAGGNDYYGRWRTGLDTGAAINEPVHGAQERLHDEAEDDAGEWVALPSAVQHLVVSYL